MDAVQEYMAKKHEHLQYNYNPEFNKARDNCEDIATHLAKLLIKQKKVPRIIRFRKPGKETIRPAIFNRQMEWGYHEVCFYNGEVYDPILEQPTDLEDYCERVFGEQVPFRTITDEFRIGVRVLHSIDRD